MAGFEKFRPRGADGCFAPRPVARRFGALGGRLRLGRQRGDALIEPRRPLIEVAAPFAELEVEHPRPAPEQVREPERAPEVERDRQYADEVQNLRRPVEPLAVRPDPGGDRLERGGEAPDRGDRRLAVQQTKAEGEREGDDRPDEQPGLAAVGPDRANDEGEASACAEGRHIPHQMTVAGVGVRSGEAKPAQPRLDRAAPRAGEDVDARAGRLEQQSVGEPGALGLDVVALQALGLEPSCQVVMAIGRRPRGALRIAAGMAGFVEQGRIIDAAGLAIERGVGGAGDRDWRLEAAPGVDMRHHHLRQRAPA